MFDIGWSEMAIVILLALIVIGPKDLPRALRTMGQYMRKARALSREFQSGLNEVMREAELDEARKAIEGARSGSLDRQIRKALDPDDEIDRELRELDRDARRTGTAGRSGAAKGGGAKAGKAKVPDAAEGSDSSAAKGSDSARKAAAENPDPAGPAHQGARAPGETPVEDPRTGAPDSEKVVKHPAGVAASDAPSRDDALPEAGEESRSPTTLRAERAQNAG